MLQIFLYLFLPNPHRMTTSKYPYLRPLKRKNKHRYDDRIKDLFNGHFIIDIQNTKLMTVTSPTVLQRFSTFQKLSGVKCTHHQRHQSFFRVVLCLSQESLDRSIWGSRLSWSQVRSGGETYKHTGDVVRTNPQKQ